jgi:hypothetical protein
MTSKKERMEYFVAVGLVSAVLLLSAAKIYLASPSSLYKKD